MIFRNLFIMIASFWMFSMQLTDSRQDEEHLLTVDVLKMYEYDFFYLVKTKKQKYIQKCSMLLHSAEFISHCFECFSSLSSEKERILYDDFNVTLSYERTGLHISTGRTSFSFSFLLMVRPFLHNDLLSFQLARLFFPFFLTALPFWKENATWFSLAFLLFHLPPCSLPHSSISLFLSILLFSSARLSPPFVRCAVQSCSKSRVCSCWSSSIFLRLLDPSVLSCRIS